jgi:hypothetical protein
MNSTPPTSVTASESPCSESAEQHCSPAAEQRAKSDRRKEPTSAWDAFRLAGRRMQNRRTDEHRLPYYVDRFSRGMLLCIFMLIFASLIDAGLTVHLLYAGGEEINPLMDRLLNHSIEAFVIGKYALTVVGLPLLLVFKNHYLFGTRLRVGHLIAVVVALYCVLIVYQVVLISRCAGW